MILAILSQGSTVAAAYSSSGLGTHRDGTLYRVLIPEEIDWCDRKPVAVSSDNPLIAVKLR